MNQWDIRPSYKYDLANFCNLLTLDSLYTTRHQEAYEYFRTRFDPELVNAAQAAFKQGVLLGPTISGLIGLDDYEGNNVERILAALETEAVRATFEEECQYFPLIVKIVRHVHELGLYDYWSERCLPVLEAKCRDLRSDAIRYPVIEIVNGLLGPDYAVRQDTVRLYVCHFASPHGSSLGNAGFIADQRWSSDLHVGIAIHELMHPPFPRSEIAKFTEVLWTDEFVREAKARLPLGYGYHEPIGFIEENLVEGAHIYLAEQLGVVKDPLRYFIQHDFASHVISVLVYDALKRGLRQKCGSYFEMLHLMQTEGYMVPGQVRGAYRRIYDQALLGGEHPYQPSSCQS